MITLLVTESYQCSANYIDFSQCTISEGKNQVSGDFDIKHCHKRHNAAAVE